MNLASFKDNCPDDEFDNCFKTVPTFSMCMEACSQQSGCASFAYCTGLNNPSTTLQRCYLKTANFSLIAHGHGDCATYYPRRAATCRNVVTYYNAQECCGAPSKSLDMNKAKTSGRQRF